MGSDYTLQNFKHERGSHWFLSAEAVFSSGIRRKIWATNRQVADARAPGGHERIFLGDWCLTFECPSGRAEAICVQRLVDDALVIRNGMLAAAEDELEHLEAEDEGEVPWEDDYGAMFDNQERCPTCNEIHRPPACRDPDDDTEPLRGGLFGDVVWSAKPDIDKSWIPGPPCDLCGKPKAPVGRDVAPAEGNAYCHPTDHRGEP